MELDSLHNPVVFCRCVVVPAPGAAAGCIHAGAVLGRSHLRHLLLRLALPGACTGGKLTPCTFSYFPYLTGDVFSPAFQEL